jgi:hypothetical protein
MFRMETIVSVNGRTIAPEIADCREPTRVLDVVVRHSCPLKMSAMGLWALFVLWLISEMGDMEGGAGILRPLF